MRLTGLREIDLSNCPRITAAGMKYVGQLENLEVLNMYENPVTDDGLPTRQANQLRELRLTSPKITNAGLSDLANLTSLEETPFRDEVTDAGGDLRGRRSWESFSVELQASRRRASFPLKKDVPGLVMPNDEYPRTIIRPCTATPCAMPQFTETSNH